MEPRTIGSYGGPKVDALPVSNPESQVASAEMNRYLEDMAQATRTVLRAAVSLPTTNAAAGPIAPALVSHRSVWGSGSAEKPAVEKTATGLYTVTYSPIFTDPLGVIESVTFFAGQVSCMSPDDGDILTARLLTVAANVVTIGVYAMGALADLGNASGNPFPVTVWLL
jgi:hypothetical protein